MAHTSTSWGGSTIFNMTDYASGIMSVINSVQNWIASHAAIAISEVPVGAYIEVDASFPSFPALGGGYQAADGAVISDGDSVFYGYRIRNLNGADVELTLTWTADAGGSYATVTATDLTALAVGDSVTGSGIASGTYISDISGTTVTMTDASPSGSIATTFSNGGRFLRGGSTSGVGQEDQMQRIEGEIIKTNTNATLMTGDGEVDGAFSLGTYQPAGSASALTGGSTSDRYSMVFDSADSPNARTGSETRPINTTIKYYMRIK